MLKIRKYLHPNELPFILSNPQAHELIQKQTDTIKLKTVVGHCFVMYTADFIRGLPPPHLWTPDMPLFHSYRYCTSSKEQNAETLKSYSREQWSKLLAENAPEYNTYTTIPRSYALETEQNSEEVASSSNDVHAAVASSCVVGSSTECGATNSVLQDDKSTTLATNYEREPTSSVSVGSIYDHYQLSAILGSSLISSTTFVTTLQTLRKDVVCPLGPKGPGIVAGDTPVAGLRRRVLGLRGGTALYGLLEDEEAGWGQSAAERFVAGKTTHNFPSSIGEHTTPSNSTSPTKTPDSLSGLKDTKSPGEPQLHPLATSTTSSCDAFKQSSTPARPTAQLRLRTSILGPFSPNTTTVPTPIPPRHISTSNAVAGEFATPSFSGVRRVEGSSAYPQRVLEQASSGMDESLSSFEFSSLGKGKEREHPDTPSESDQSSRRESSQNSSTGPQTSEATSYVSEHSIKSASQLLLDKEEKMVRDREQQRRLAYEQHYTRETAAYAEREQRERLDRDARAREDREKFSRDLERESGLDDMGTSAVNSADYASFWQTILDDQAFDGSEDYSPKRRRLNSFGSTSLTDLSGSSIPSFTDSNNPNHTTSDFLFDPAFTPSAASSVSHPHHSAAASSPVSDAAWYPSSNVSAPSHISRGFFDRASPGFQVHSVQPALPPLGQPAAKASPLHALLSRMITVDPGRGAAYGRAYTIMSDHLVGPDVIVELGCAGLERLGIKAGVAARILMEVKREETEVGE
ncbi:hypothetical protein P7C70_g3552, partial [Phenoliferia sp. Uapishka_3]